MARSLFKLTVKKAQSIKIAGNHSDGGNLYLHVKPKSLSKSWAFIYVSAGKRRVLGLGTFGNVPLEDARKKAAEYRVLLENGLDPLEAKRNKAQPEPDKMTFKQCADAFIDSHRSGWKNPKHVQQWQNTIEQYCNPIIGNLPVADINTDLVKQCLTPIWKTKNETADRLRGRIERVLDWAKVSGHRNGENPARWRGHLDKLLPSPKDIQNPKHHAALPYSEIKTFMEELRQHDCTAAKCLEFTILTAARTGDTIGAVWSEFDLDTKLWTVPKERIKGKKRPHLVPLSVRCVAILKEQAALRVNEFIFGGLSNNAMLALLERMNRSDITVHGFRSTFKDWAAEETEFSNEVSEMCLAHTIKNLAEAAYRRGDLIEKRRRVMDDWLTYCNKETAVIADEL